MDLINVDPSVQPIPLLALVHPHLVVPDVLVGRRDESGRTGAQFITLRIRIGLGQDLASCAIADLITVQRMCGYFGQEQFPYAAGTMRTHRVDPAIPTVEFAHHTDTFSVRSPYGKTHAFDAVDFDRMRAEHAVTLT